MQCNCQVMSIFVTYNTLHYNLDVMKRKQTVSYMPDREGVMDINRYLSAWTCTRNSPVMCLQGCFNRANFPRTLPATVQVACGVI